MFNSNITAKAFVEGLKREVDAAPGIEDETYYRFIDEAEQLLYSEIIREIHAVSLTGENEVALSSVKEEGADSLRFEDILAVYSGDVQLIRTPATGGRGFPDCYWKAGEKLGFNSENKTLNIYYCIRPALKSGGGENQPIRLPAEWVPIIASRVRGEAYKLVNEDAQAAKWLAEYNALVESFRQYMAARLPALGIGGSYE